MTTASILVFATWGKSPWEWWSGFKKLCEKYRDDTNLEISAVISNYSNGWVADKAKEYWIPFEHIQLDKNYNNNISKYEQLIEKYKPDLIALSGYLKMIDGLGNISCINIHPGPLTSEYSWLGMYGHHVHDAIWKDYQEWKIKKTCISMHFVNPDQYDDANLLFFQYPIELEWCQNADDVAKKVNKAEHERQHKITKMVALWEIRLEKDEKDNPIKIHYPEWYEWNKIVDLKA